MASFTTPTSFFSLFLDGTQPIKRHSSIVDLSKNIEENIDDFTKLIQDIKLTGDKNIDDYKPIVLLNAIPEAYSDVKAAIKYGRDNVSLDTVINGLKSKEMDIKTNKTSQSHNEVNIVRGRTKNRNSDYKYRKHSKGRSRSRSRSKSRTRDDRNKDNKTKERRCYNCGIKGHYIKDCRKPKRDNRENNYKEDANVVTENSGDVFMVCDVNNVHCLNMHEWLIDSSCTFHLSPFKEIFTNFESGNFDFVSMANEKRCEIQDLGDICLTFKDGYKLTLKNVKYVPDLNHNLIPCAVLEEEGLEGRWGKGIMEIMKGFLTVFKADRKRNMYVCSVNYDILAASVTDYDKTSLWHKRLGHISLKGLELLQKEGVIVDKIEKLKFCDECYRKQHKVQFPASQPPNPSSSSSILDYVHAYVWGPSNIPTHGDTSQNKKNLDLDLTFNKVEGQIDDNQQGEENQQNTETAENSNFEGLEDYQLARDRDRREPKIPAKYNDFHIALNIESCEPSSVEEALKSENSKN
ncbi:UNVERIFIED_CONTAM: Retrovirus-related Pol polyprotein from transposon TNT 1-94 [Sesamum radiatum]|uniref:Retrovirus-related Pol polyprotein from transposon TNT 1-94 n=1 Tax=Sesamum radiatum TaxID=300843 RepID=A0AAW2LEW4_SESRA